MGGVHGPDAMVPVAPNSTQYVPEVSEVLTAAVFIMTGRLTAPGAVSARRRMFANSVAVMRLVTVSPKTTVLPTSRGSPSHIWATTVVNDDVVEDPVW